MRQHPQGPHSPRHLSRRTFILTGGVLAGLALTRPLSAGATVTPRYTADPFSLGVASGDPGAHSVVLWTRLAPDPLNGGGMPPFQVPIAWEVATDDQMQRVVRRGRVLAEPEWAHSVHVEVHGLEPDRWYWYRFHTGDAASAIGRTRTLPAAHAPAARLRFAFVNCQDWQNGFYTAYHHLAADDLDLVIHLGDYIYADGQQSGLPRLHNGPEAYTLADYRDRYALYKTDPLLQAVHASFPMVATWDDWEVDNNYAGVIPEEGDDPAIFLPRRAAAYQAYFEHLPLRWASRPYGPHMALYRRLTFGDLAEFSILDTRQYRTDQPCGDNLQPRCAASLAESQTMLGAKQERWLLQGLGHSRAHWNVIAQQVMMAELEIPGALVNMPGQQMFSMDQWDGYVAARDRLLGFIAERQPSNPVVLSGDFHASWAADLKADFANPASATLATEFVGPSVTSNFPRQFIPLLKAALSANPHLKFFDGVQNGYVRCDVDRTRWQSDYRVVESILTDEAPMHTLASFVIEAGRPGAQTA